mmetsp:Transcript_12064/g.28320  ORF Transcript_12064/g.28320 Transcript_12064/m.28320 type:complete len:275 (+) Transcript_12064:2186-3010(+)
MFGPSYCADLGAAFDGGFAAMNVGSSSSSSSMSMASSLDTREISGRDASLALYLFAASRPALIFRVSASSLSVSLWSTPSEAAEIRGDARAARVDLRGDLLPRLGGDGKSSPSERPRSNVSSRSMIVLDFFGAVCFLVAAPWSSSSESESMFNTAFLRVVRVVRVGPGLAEGFPFLPLLSENSQLSSESDSSSEYLSYLAAILDLAAANADCLPLPPIIDSSLDESESPSLASSSTGDDVSRPSNLRRLLSENIQSSSLSRCISLRFSSLVVPW